jgi:hypothetical protein
MLWAIQGISANRGRLSLFPSTLRVSDFSCFVIFHINYFGFVNLDICSGE